MRSLPGWCLAAWVAATAAAAGEPLAFTCLPDESSEDWRVAVNVDADRSVLSWDGEAWELVKLDERSIVARMMESGRPSSLLINRETGRFWQTYTGRYCNNADCSSTLLSSLVVQGRCIE